jgi:uncharacterized membrane protein YqgA involved in biofilm formation
MKYRAQVYKWGPFIAASIATRIAFAKAWDSQWYGHILVALGLLSLIFGIRVLAKTGLRLWPIAGVLLGLAIGQLWFLEFVFAWIAWKGLSP